MGNSRRSFYALIIAGVSFLFVIGALLTALAETGYSPSKPERATDTIIPLLSSTFTLKPPTAEPEASTATLEEKTPESTKTKDNATLTATVTSSTVSSSATATATTPVLAACTTPIGWIKYKVQSGDTLFSIAIRYQTNVATLQAGNCMGSSTKIITGTTLWVPNNPTITPSKTAKPTATEVICYSLTLSKTGSGNDLTSSPEKSEGCTSGKYTAGEKITLAASPAAGWTVIGWTGTDNNASTEATNSVTMPAGDHNASIVYSQCFALTLTHEGLGADPTALPTNSNGCPAGSFIEGASITLTAAPDGAGTVIKWNDNEDNSLTYALTMPASAFTVTVTYDP